MTRVIFNKDYFKQIKQSYDGLLEGEILNQYNNPLLALCAYGIGLGGLNPTFFKVIGNSTGGDAKFETFSEHGHLTIPVVSDIDEENKLNFTIIDNNSFGGLQINYTVEPKTTESDDEGKITNSIVKYLVALEIRFDSSNVLIEVTKLDKK